MNGCFNVSENPEDEFDIRFQVKSDLQYDIPDEQESLYLEAERLCTIIKSMTNTDISIKRKYYSKLLTLSQVGLVPETVQIKSANLALSSLKEEILLVEGKRIKNNYMKQLGLFVILIIFFSSVAIAITYKFNGYNWIYNCCIAFVGSAIGTWISFGARKFEMELEDLSSIEKDKMGPLLRLVYISVSSIVFMLFMNIGIVEVKIGTLDTLSVFSDLKCAFVCGIICGLVESKVGINIYQKATSLFPSN